MLSTGLANTDVVCSSIEYLHVNPPSDESCQTYFQSYIDSAGGYLENPDATTDCSYCSLKYTNDFLTSVSSKYSERWRNLGILWAFIAFNCAGAIFLYWLARVPKKPRKSKKD